ncbi:MAG: cyclic nucleotide-binding domain-containing protein, partial [Nitrospirota bacterium]|nr:cyclic nucleotide-binding domain-containing protein [Nitrospirota bacterium]
MARPLSTLSREDKLSRLSSTILFTEFSKSELLDFYEELEWLCIRGGETLLRQGEQDQSLYVVLTGRLRVFVIGQDGQEGVVGEVCQGEIIGEMAILTGEPRSASVRAIRDSEVARLTPVAWDRLLEKYPR